MHCAQPPYATNGFQRYTPYSHPAHVAYPVPCHSTFPPFLAVPPCNTPLYPSLNLIGGLTNNYAVSSYQGPYLPIVAPVPCSAYPPLFQPHVDPRYGITMLDQTLARPLFVLGSSTSQLSSFTFSPTVNPPSSSLRQASWTPDQDESGSVSRSTSPSGFLDLGGSQPEQYGSNVGLSLAVPPPSESNMSALTPPPESKSISSKIDVHGSPKLLDLIINTTNVAENASECAEEAIQRTEAGETPEIISVTAVGTASSQCQQLHRRRKSRASSSKHCRKSTPSTQGEQGE